MEALKGNCGDSVWATEAASRPWDSIKGSRWANWFFSDRSTRSLLPFHDVNPAKYLENRVDENTLTSLREALNLSPTHALASARLALKVLENGKDPRAAKEAAWLIQRAIREVKPLN